MAGLLGAAVVVGAARTWLIRAFRIQERDPRLAAPGGSETAPEGVAARVPTRRNRTLAARVFLPHPGRPVAVVVHGWGAGGADMLVLTEPLRRAGFNAVIFDARAHGASDDESFASLPRFAEDTEAVMDWLAARGLGPVALIGHSVGAGAVLLVASRRPEVAAVVALSPFSHPRPIMNTWLAAHGIRWRPVQDALNRLVELSIGHRFDTIAPVNTIKAITAPVLIVHGTADQTVPPWHAEAVAAARPDVPLMRLPGVGHDDTPGFTRHLDAVLGWLKGVVPG
ncbi:alpha/beta hydrolase [Pararhodospirillum oryzae]|uniref:alpha/beta hydrolase n=1 Tax=Pararhodospirillum oryzae TaxID=478448 RepID=UPI0014782C39|nr:alpha/beta fold hydrolase [Pararhodospirillum oryzae]